MYAKCVVSQFCLQTVPSNNDDQVWVWTVIKVMQRIEANHFVIIITLSQ